VVAVEVDEVGLEEMAVWLERSNVEAREECAQWQQEIAVVDYDADLNVADSKAHEEPTPLADTVQH
jgi:hypothetical protein